MKFAEQTSQVFRLVPQLEQFTTEQLICVHVVEFIREKFGAGHEQVEESGESWKLS